VWNGEHTEDGGEETGTRRSWGWGWEREREKEAPLGINCPSPGSSRNASRTQGTTTDAIYIIVYIDGNWFSSTAVKINLGNHMECPTETLSNYCIL
jgi:hypothetical protein